MNNELYIKDEKKINYLSKFEELCVSIQYGLDLTVRFRRELKFATNHFARPLGSPWLQRFYGKCF